MKIMMVARRFPPDVLSGTERVFENLYRQAIQSHEVRLVVGFTKARDQVPEEAVAVDLRGLSKPKAWARIFKASLREEARFQPDVVLGNSIEVMSRKAPLACIVHDLNFGSPQPSLGNRAKRGFYKLRARFSKTLITVSEAALNSLGEAGLSPKHFHVVHNGVDLDQFSSMPKQGDEDVIRFAYPSRILPGKGQHLAIDALARLPRLHKRRATLQIVGAVADPIFRDQLRVQAHEQPVSFATDVTDIAPFYQGADIILFPTLLEEGFGYTAVEAMACGKPVIYFDQAAIREATGGIGIAVPKGDVDALRDAMKALMDDPQRREELGRKGRAYVEAHYAWPVVWSKYEAILQGLLP
jgi:glycosyltransferase involved in cell wall biosynthesis